MSVFVQHLSLKFFLLEKQNARRPGSIVDKIWTAIEAKETVNNAQLRGIVDNINQNQMYARKLNDASLSSLEAIATQIVNGNATVVRAPVQENENEASEEELESEVAGLETDQVETECGLTEEVSKQFEDTYKNLDDEKKWTLASGNKVENIIYKYGLTLKHEVLVHSFVIDTDDEKIRALFSADEWREIVETNIREKNPPKIEADLLHHLARFRKTDARDLREVVNMSRREGIDYDAESHFNFTWVTNCISNLLSLYEIKPHVFLMAHLERWYDTNVWSSIIDQCMWDLKNVELVRGESFSIASNERKCEGRTIEERKPVGHRGDGVLRMEMGRQEYGASEHGRLFQGKNDTKFLSDSRKLTKLLKDMMTSLSEEIDTEVLKKVELVGYLHSERMMQIYVLDYPEGYVVRLRKGHIFGVPKSLEKIDDLLKLMSAVLSSKLRIARTTRLLQTSGELSVQAFTTELLAAGQIDRSNDKKRLRLPSAFPTPKKRKKTKSCFDTKSPPHRFSLH